MLNEILKLNQTLIRYLPEICKDIPKQQVVSQTYYHPWCQLFDAGLINMYAYNESNDPRVYLTFRKENLLIGNLPVMKFLNAHFDVLYINDTYILCAYRKAFKINWFTTPDVEDLEASVYGDRIWTYVRSNLGLYFTTNNIPLNLVYNTKSGKKLFATEYNVTESNVPDKLLPDLDIEKETFRKAKTLLYSM